MIPVIIILIAIASASFTDVSTDLAAIADAVRTQYELGSCSSSSYVSANDLGAYVSPECSAMHGNYSNCDCNSRKVSYQHAGVVAGDSTFGACLYSETSSTLTDIADAEYLWSYMGFNDGTHVSYPAHRYMTTTISGYCKTPVTESAYDPRSRLWYMNGVAGPINIVFIIDQSGSMTSTGVDRLEKVQQVVETIILGLSPSTKVGIVSFGGSGVIRAELTVADNNGGKDDLLTALWNIMSTGSTNFQDGFQKASDTMYAPSAATDCQNVFVFLSDGIPDGTQGAETADLIQDGDIVYSIAFGDNVGRSVMEEIACRHGGDYVFIPDDDSESAMLEKLAGFYDVLGQSATSEGIMWTEFYTDSTSGLDVVTGTMNVMSGTGDDMTLIGVVGIDLVCDATCQASPEYANMLAASLSCRTFKEYTCMRDRPWGGIPMDATTVLIIVAVLVALGFFVKTAKKRQQGNLRMRVSQQQQRNRHQAQMNPPMQMVPMVPNMQPMMQPQMQQPMGYGY